MKIKIITIAATLFITVISSAQQIGNGQSSEITDFSAALGSGTYQGLSPIGMNPDVSYGGWQHLFVVRHSNLANNHQLQLSSSYSENDRLFFRKKAASVNPSWIELATRGTNNFVGDQIINGNLGIGTGTENPSAPLTVYGKSVIFPARIGSGDARSFVVDHTASNLAFISNNYPVVLKTGGGDQPLILDASRIGIGTTNPSKKLDIYSSSTTALKISTGDPSTYATEIHLGGSADFTKSAIISTPNAAGWYRQDLFFCLANGNNTSSVGISDAAMVIKSYNSGKFGNVGIGTINPDEKLTVNGKIHAQEVRIDLSSPMTVPDYVFANDYKLKSLQEVEAYIKQNSHLPEIPSAKEIEKNGLMLAEMNMSLLKKIEELTLYSIDQNKKIETQAKEIESLKDLVLRVTKIESELARK